MTFETLVRERGVEAYAAFFAEKLGATDVVLDCGCGAGSITVGLAERVPGGRVVGVDLAAGDFGPARAYARQQGLTRLAFGAADITRLPFAKAAFTALLCHSALETLADPVAGLVEMRRVLQPGGLIGVASVEYEGVVVAGPHEALLKGFYAVREALWLREGAANPRLGKHLRALLHQAGFERVAAHLAYASHGTDEAVARFGEDRARECADDWFAVEAARHGLLTAAELEEMAAAWRAWAASSAAFLAFTWSRAIGWKPAG